jgi:flagellar hook-length control protein FliK
VAAARPAAAGETESRTVGREGENSVFAEAMEAQAPRDDGDACRDRKSTVDEAGEAGEATGATAAAVAPGACAPAPQTAPTDPGVDAMLGLCTPQPGVPASPPTWPPPPVLPASVGPTAPTPELAGAAPGAASETRALLEGELQKRLVLGSAAIVAVAGGVASANETVSSTGSLEDGSGGTAAVGPSGAAGEIRTPERPAAAPMAQAPGRAPELRASLGSTLWADQLGARVTWMVDRGEQVASLRLSPENMGPVEVRIAVREGETSVWFGATQAETRAALEQSLPRLREMLGASGLSLADAGVFGHTPRDPQRGFTSAALARAAQESGADPAGGIVMQVSLRGLVDLYA